ncbi:MAG: DUF1580 domain-containing protein [Planctomycetes bacterium]|nr:DUF1580 domain-containing protein [Planctomycetota bacterium]
MRKGYRCSSGQGKPAALPARPGQFSPCESSRLDREELVPLTTAAAWIADRTGGRRPNVSTLHRWASRGCRGVRLETVFVGHARFTSLEAIRRFFHAKPTSQDGVTVVNVAPDKPVAVVTAADDVAELHRRVFRQR